MVLGFGQGKDVDGVNLLPVRESGLQNLVCCRINLSPRGVTGAASLGPSYLHSQVLVGVLPLERRG